MKKWEKKAEQDKMRYQEEMKTYVPAEDPTGGRKGKILQLGPHFNLKSCRILALTTPTILLLLLTHDRQEGKEGPQRSQA